MSAPTFADIKAVRAHLAELGYKRGQSTVYKDVKDGLLRATGEGGVYTIEDVERYTKAAGLKKVGQVDTTNDALAQRKRKAAVEDQEEVLRIRRLKRQEMEGSLVSRAQVESDLADRARLLRASLHNFVRGEVDTLIAMAGGDPNKAPEVLAYLENAVDEILHSYARKGRIDLEQPR